MELTCTEIQEGGKIPIQFTCDGEDISPGLQWTGIPEKTISLVLICDDPDAPVGTWVHWVLFNIPGNMDAIEEGVDSVESIKSGGSHGINDFRKLGYGGPCPPNGTHRYFFRLYALDTMLDLNPGCTKADLMEAMQGHILGQATLMGKYSR
ncbi:YbhB/YbcL family Raf kinase inhibitor-like protein [Bacteroidota bacterium]